MDNKVNKTRLYNLFSYDWLKIIAVIVGIILCWEVFYALGSVKLTTGQYFTYYFDYDVVSGDSDAWTEFVNDDKFLSYDVLSKNSNRLMRINDILSIKLTIQEGDIIISQDKPVQPEDNFKNVIAMSRVDSGLIYDLDQLYADAKEYVSGFIKEGYSFDTLDLLGDDTIDLDKVSDCFTKRLAGDNRFRTPVQWQEGLLLEKGRIINLYKDVKDLGKYLTFDDSYFFTYVRYKQQYELSDPNSSFTEDYKKKYEKELSERGEKRYGIRLDKLEGGAGKTDITKFFKMSGESTAKYTMMMAYNFKKYQPDLQYETVSFMMGVVRATSTLLD